MSTTLVHKALVAQFLTELFERRSDEPLQHLITSDFQLHGLEPGSALRGLAGLQAPLWQLRAEFENPRLRIEDLFAEGDRVAARYSFEADEAGTVARPVRLAGLLLARVQHGRVAECWSHEGVSEALMAGPARTDSTDVP